MSGPAPRLPGLPRRAAVWAAVAALGVGGAAFAGCDLPGTGDDEETVATTPTTTDTEATGPTGPSGENGGGGGGGGGGGRDKTPADTGPTVPESGGVGAEDTYDPEQDTEENDLPPPAGSPQEQFEQACDENPGLCD